MYVNLSQVIVASKSQAQEVVPNKVKQLASTKIWFLKWKESPDFDLYIFEL